MGSGEVDGGVLVVASGQATPLLELVDAPLNGVPLLASLTVEGWRAAPNRPRRLRFTAWSAGCGIDADPEFWLWPEFREAA